MTIDTLFKSILTRLNLHTIDNYQDLHPKVKRKKTMHIYKKISDESQKIIRYNYNTKEKVEH